jgi:hypothetical protein
VPSRTVGFVPDAKNLYPQYLTILLVQVKIFHLLLKVKFIRTLFYLAREIKAKKKKAAIKDQPI